MSNKPIVAIVALGVIGLACMAVAAYYLGNESPKVKVKIALEHEMPWITVSGIETRAEGEGPARVVTQRLRIEPRDPARPLGIGDLEEAGERAAQVMTASDLKLPIRLDAIEVAGPGDLATPSWSRAEVDERKVLGGTVRAVEPELAQLAGLPPETRLRLLGAAGKYGVGYPVRPPAPHTEGEVAGITFRKLPMLRYVEVPAAEAGKPPVRVRNPAIK